MIRIGKPLRISKKDNLVDSAASKSGDNICPKCGNTDFSYDSFWDESCCRQCGWILPGNKVNEIKSEQSHLQSGEQQGFRKKEITSDDSKFSYSRISLFKNCPKAYHFKYILRKEELFSSIEQHLGKSIHTALENAYRKKGGDEGNISLNYLLKAFDQAWNSPERENVRVIKKNTEPRDYYSDGQDMLKKYYYRVMVPDRSQTVALEKYFEITIGDSLRYRGYIDRISKNPNGLLRITDFKSGKRVNEPLEDMQLCSYALWCFDEFKVNEIEIAFEALRHGRTLCGIKKRSQIPIINKKLITDINSVMTATAFEARPSILCNWCGYNSLCEQAM